MLHWAAGETTTQRTLVEDETMRHDPYGKGYVGMRGKARAREKKKVRDRDGRVKRVRRRHSGVLCGP